MDDHHRKVMTSQEPVRVFFQRLSADLFGLPNRMYMSSLPTCHSFNVIYGIHNGRFKNTTFLYICIFFAIKRFFTTERCLKCSGAPFASFVNWSVLILCILNVGCHIVSTDRRYTRRGFTPRRHVWITSDISRFWLETDLLWSFLAGSSYE